ncbi:short-chain dehydrogenase/reductase-like protein [Hyaloscypha variabilis F]|uniref:Short-chain dehydrogenase/reductase-like protein n=1 Tax=Hyaloscypha variabilis (strain UAMH 11265 / GT02V1 / F) TaxID=1149755 RepID=A0A2J6S0Z8_HYAVF|nr:short-chain dehydrogenase/reductase-like protein [Hyaloscypha variabilis F]
MSLNDFKFQLQKLPPLKADFTGKTVIVVGSNTGLGKEAVRHFVRLNASKVIIAVRSISKGKAAQEDIETSTYRHGVTEVWEIDLARSASVKEFAARVAALPRVDAVVANASVATAKLEILEENESMVTVNVINTMLLVLLLVPILQVSALKWNIVPVISVVSSDIHSWTKFPAWKAPNILEAIKTNMKNGIPEMEGYAVSKLMQIFAVREIAARMTKENIKVALNVINPGLAKTELARHATGVSKIGMMVAHALLARTAEEASKTLVYAASVGMESHGLYFTNSDVTNPLSDFVTSKDGGKAQNKLWGELEERFEKIQPGIMATL